MSAAQLIIECGLLETRAALIDQQGVLRIWFGPPPGREATDRSLRRGRSVIGRISSINTALNAAFVDIGRDQQGYLPLRGDEPSMTEGTLIEAAIIAPPRRTKGAVLSLKNGNYTGKADLGSFTSLQPAVLEAVRGVLGTAENNTEIIVAGAPIEPLLVAGYNAVPFLSKTSIALFASNGVDEALENAFRHRSPMAEGGALIIDETEALVAIDVDTGTMQSASADRLREKIALASADSAVRQIMLRNLSGRIVIDFPSVRVASIRDRMQARIKERLSSIPGVSSVTLSRGNFAVITRERRGLSLLEQATVPTTDLPVPGRRFTIEWQAQSAIRHAEWGIAIHPRPEIEIALSPQLEAFLEACDLCDAFQQRYGVRLVLSKSTAPLEGGFEIRQS